MAQDDPELFPWLEAASGRTDQPGGGGFVRTIAEAGLRADYENYALLRPVLLKLKDKYPEYAERQR